MNIIRCLAGTACAALLLSAAARAESQLAQPHAQRELTAQAHVDFKIIIPPLLSLSLGADGRADAATVTSNARSLLLGGRIVLGGARGAPLRQALRCTPPPAASAPARLICTAAMP